jgi:predicted tellurium resistance membrane protein TerC
MRQLSHPAVRLGVFLALLLSLRELVWVSRVFENMSHKNGVIEFIQYGISAFIGTEFVVQLVLIVGAGIVAYSAKDLFSMRQQQFA